MLNRRTMIIFAIIAAFILVGSLMSGLDTQASEPFGQTVQGASELAVTYPDLTVSRVEVLTMTATSLDYLFVIQNIGLITADLDGSLPGSSDDVFYQAVLSDDNVYGNLGDQAAGSVPLTQGIAELGPGEEYTYTSQSALQGVYYFDYDYFLVKVDAYDSLVEANEDNNVGEALLPDGPDLIVENVEVLSINSEGVVYQFTVRNIGDGMADLDGPDDGIITDNIGFRGVLSPDDTIDNAGDKGAGGSYLLSPTELYPGEAFTHSFSAGMGGANYLDFHYLFVEIDSAKKLPETDEDNNIGMTEILHYLYLPLILR